MSDTIKKIKRSEFATFLKAPTVITRMGMGITEQEVAYNAETTEEKYIHEDSPTTIVEGYAVSLDTTQTCYKNEPIFEYIDSLRRTRAIGTAATTKLYKVYLYDKKENNSYGAEESDCSIAISSFSGNSISYTVNENGDPVQGTVAITNGVPVFTATPIQE